MSGAPDAIAPPDPGRVALTMADIRRRVERALERQDVSRETMSPPPYRRGTGTDWSKAEIDCLVRHRTTGAAVSDIMSLLPGRTENAIRLKLARLGIALQARRGIRNAPPRRKRVAP